MQVRRYSVRSSLVPANPTCLCHTTLLQSLSSLFDGNHRLRQLPGSVDEMFAQNNGLGLPVYFELGKYSETDILRLCNCRALQCRAHLSKMHKSVMSARTPPGPRPARLCIIDLRLQPGSRDANKKIPQGRGLWTVTEVTCLECNAQCTHRTM